MRLFRLIFLVAFVVFHVLLLKYFGPWQQEEAMGPMIKVYCAEEKKVLTLPLESYLLGVMAWEIPASFEMEALKAQAVAARTYSLKKVEAAQKGSVAHAGGAPLCTDPAHCQGWLTEKGMKEKWGLLSYQKYRSRLKAALKETQGTVVLWDNSLIDPVYHAACGGHTEDGAAVWKNQLPYLTGVVCSWDKNAPKYEGQASFTIGKFSEKLGIPVPERKFTSASLELLSQTKTGRVEKVRIFGRDFSGKEVREKLALYSTRFTWQVQGDAIVFSTRGYGHGVGLCQYGANGMAKTGNNYQEILTYYYQGVTMKKIY